VKRIVQRIMCVERANYATPECRNVAIGHALSALGVLADLLPDQRQARLFAARQLGNPRAATSAKARKFLKSKGSAAFALNRQHPKPRAGLSAL
jgi:hypothetical protein